MRRSERLSSEERRQGGGRSGDGRIVPLELVRLQFEERLVLATHENRMKRWEYTYNSDRNSGKAGEDGEELELHD